MNDTTTVTTDRLAADETDRLISSEKIEGTAVYDRTVSIWARSITS